MHNIPPQLQSWLVDPNTHTCKRDVPTLAVELGPNGSFYARDKDSYRWHNLPDALEEAIQQRLCPAGWTARPDLVVLGADGAFIYSNDGGGHCYALGNYPKLQEHIVGLQRANVGGLTGFALVHVSDSSTVSVLWLTLSIVDIDEHLPARPLCCRPQLRQLYRRTLPQFVPSFNQYGGYFPRAKHDTSTISATGGIITNHATPLSTNSPIPLSTHGSTSIPTSHHAILPASDDSRGHANPQTRLPTYGQPTNATPASSPPSTKPPRLFAHTAGIPSTACSSPPDLSPDTARPTPHFANVNPSAPRPGSQSQYEAQAVLRQLQSRGPTRVHFPQGEWRE